MLRVFLMQTYCMYDRLGRVGIMPQRTCERVYVVSSTSVYGLSHGDPCVSVLDLSLTKSRNITRKKNAILTENDPYNPRP